MWPALEEYRRANGPILVVVLMSVTSTLLGAGLIWAFGMVADWWWAILAAAFALTVTISSLRAWYREWKRAEGLAEKVDELARALVDEMAQAREAKQSLEQQALRHVVLRSIAEYLNGISTGIDSVRLAKRVNPHTVKLWRALSDDERHGPVTSPIASATTTIANLAIGKENPRESLGDAMLAIAATYDLQHLATTPPVDPPPPKPGS
jgi:hypothetical protein